MEATHPGAVPDPAPPRVLIVEDDPDTSSLIAATVERAFRGSTTTRAGSISAMVETDLSGVDLVLCDHILPDGNAFDVIELVSRRRHDLPVMVITGERATSVAAEAIRRGASDYLPKSVDFLTLIPALVAKTLEAARVRRDNQRLQAALASSLAELKRKNRELAESADRYKSLASIDSLTGLVNRRVLDERLVHMFAEAQRYRAPLTCLMIDLDGFKQVNDTLGHRLGDQLLELAGQLISREIRTSDVGARYGGDEFVVLLPHTDPADAAVTAERLRRKFELGASVLTQRGATCTMSIGVASTRSNPVAQPWQLLAHADFALYRAKESEGLGIMLCDPGGESATPYRPEAA